MRAGMLACGAIAGLAALAPLATAAPAHHQPRVARSGVVVDWAARAHTATVALPGGRLLAVHARRAVRPGARVRLGALGALPDGSFRARLRVIGHVDTALVRGTVVARLGLRAVALGAPGTTVAVHLGAAPRIGVQRAMEVGANVPPVGAQVSGQVSINADGELSAPDLNEDSAPVAGQTLDVEGTIATIDPAGGTLTLSVSDDDLNATLAITVPAGIDISSLKAGDEVELSVTQNADGSFTLASLDDQEGDNQAGDAGQAGPNGNPTLAPAQDNGQQGQAGDQSPGEGQQGDQGD